MPKNVRKQVRIADRSPAHVEQIIDELCSVEAFQKLSQPLLHDLATFGICEILDQGILLFREGSEACNWYAIIEGVIDVFHKEGKNFSAELQNISNVYRRATTTRRCRSKEDRRRSRIKSGEEKPLRRDSSANRTVVNIPESRHFYCGNGLVEDFDESSPPISSRARRHRNNYYHHYDIPYYAHNGVMASGSESTSSDMISFEESTHPQQPPKGSRSLGSTPMRRKFVNGPIAASFVTENEKDDCGDGKSYLAPRGFWRPIRRLHSDDNLLGRGSGNRGLSGRQESIPRKPSRASWQSKRQITAGFLPAPKAPFDPTVEDSSSVAHNKDSHFDHHSQKEDLPPASDQILNSDRPVYAQGFLRDKNNHSTTFSTDPEGYNQEILVGSVGTNEGLNSGSEEFLRNVQIVRCGHILRTLMIHNAPDLIKDQKYQSRTYHQCMSGEEISNWLMDLDPSHIHNKMQAVGIWQLLLEEGILLHVTYEHPFVSDQFLLYRWAEDEESAGSPGVPLSSAVALSEAESELSACLSFLAELGPDALFRAILQKPSEERLSEEVEFVYEELLHIKAVSHLSTMVKRELAHVVMYEQHQYAGTVLFNQGDEGKSWYIILKGSVNVVIYGKGVVCVLHESDDFGKLALVNDAPRAATIVLRENNCQFLRVDKQDFNRILRDVEANTVRLKEHGQDVLVLERIPVKLPDREDTLHRYSVMAGTPEKMLEYLLETRLDVKEDARIADTVLEDFLLTHLIFLSTNTLCNSLMVYYRQGCSVSGFQNSTDTLKRDSFPAGTGAPNLRITIKRRVVKFIYAWISIARHTFFQSPIGTAFVEELYCAVMEDVKSHPILLSELSLMEQLMQERELAMKENTRPPHVIIDCGVMRYNSDALIRPFDTCIVKIFGTALNYTTLKVRMDHCAGYIIQCACKKLEIDANQIPAGSTLQLVEVRASGEKVVFSNDDFSIPTMLSSNGRLFVALQQQVDSLGCLRDQEGPLESMHECTLDEVNSTVFAYHLALMHWDLLVCTHEYEFIYQVFGRRRFGPTRIPSNLDLLIRRFNELQYWVPTEIVLCHSLTKRINLLKKFIKMAGQSKAYHDLLSFFAIILGLSNVSVSRLSLTWDKLPGKFRKTYLEYEALLNPSRNHRSYRLLASKLTPPVVPFVPLLLKDLTFTNDGNKTYFDGLVNFEKMHMIAQTLRMIRHCKSRPFIVEPPSARSKLDVSRVIRNLHVIDNQRRLCQLSYKLEPPKKAH